MLKAKNNLSLFVIVVTMAIGLNYQIISYNMMYFEQPLLYSANQQIHSFYDLLQRYLHPQFLSLTVPFFRPSGHYLLYYFLIPFTGWHNQQALIIVNLFFLGCCGFFIIAIYEQLFQRKLGGFIAYAIFLMHPAMIMSRITIMHFEYAYLFLSLAAVFCFIRFAQQKVYDNFIYLAFAILLFAVATTFKEPALMLGPVFCLFLLIQNGITSLQNRTMQKIFLLITFITCTLFLYLTSPWPTLLNHPTGANSFAKKYWALIELTKIFLCIQTQTKAVVWQLTAAPLLARIVMMMGSGLLLSFAWPANYKKLPLADKKALVFLAAAALAFLILPVVWAMAMPWHLALTLICFAMMIGFAIEVRLQSKQILFHRIVACLIVITIASITLTTNQKAIQLVQSRFGFALDLNKNAIFSPPPIQNKLNAQSIIVVADNVLQNPYELGNSRYPKWLAQHDWISNILRGWEQNNFLKSQPIFNGNLFKFAYQIPTLREEEYPFSINKLRAVSNEILYTWLQHINNIFCFTYDAKGQWIDVTEEFKHNLLAEEKFRQMPVHTYQEVTKQTSLTHQLMHFLINVPTAEACEMKCDELNQCKGFVMYRHSYDYKLKNECVLYSALTTPKPYNQDSQVYLKN